MATAQAYKMKYINWEGKEKEWDVQNEGVYFLRSTEKITNSDGAYISNLSLGAYPNAHDLNQTLNLVLSLRPDLKGKVQAVKAPCIFDGFKTYIIVDRWI